jgi:hypothetical protein
MTSEQAASTGRVTLATLLEGAGFRVRRSRADCPHCQGHARSTVAFSEAKGVAFCHRCHWKTSKRALAKRRGIEIPTRRPGLAKARTRTFRRWLSKITWAMANEERRRTRRTELAKIALSFYPGHEAAWAALAEWYHARRRFELFWEAAGDNIGRRELYRVWRRANA